MLNAQSHDYGCEDRDRLAWQAICHWSDHADVEVVQDGIDYAHLLRCFLCDKVARAIRRQSDPEGFQFEEQLVAQPEFSDRLQPHLSERIKHSMLQLYAFRDALKLRTRALTAPILFAPYRHPRLKSTLLALSRSPDLLLTTPYLRSPDYAAGYPIRLPRQFASKRHAEYADHLFQGVLQGLGAWHIELLPIDAVRLNAQIFAQVVSIEEIRTELNFLRPQAVLVFSDNHYPVQGYVHVARHLNIPTIMLQHGLDCEQHCLEEAYASAIAVWGNARRLRYQQASVYQPDRIQITGNPEFDHLRLPEQIHPTGNYWLWVTRPHRPEKCYSPSRHPHEGLDILDALAGLLKRSPSTRLLIKPHPYDYADLYQEYTTRHHLGDQIEVTQASVQSLLADASLVISEDSTAGLEAMFLGKIVVHAHFAASPPILPFVEYGAALPGYSSDQLQTALEQAQLLTPIEQDHMLQGQRHFIQDYAGVSDGEAQQRVVSLISEVVGCHRRAVFRKR